MKLRRELLKNEVKSLLMFSCVYAIGVFLFFQFASAQKKEISSWVIFGAAVALFAYVLPALWRISIAAKSEKK